jgi:hypothetical protein
VKIVKKLFVEINETCPSTTTCYIQGSSNLFLPASMKSAQRFALELAVSLCLARFDGSCVTAMLLCSIFRNSKLSEKLYSVDRYTLHVYGDQMAASSSMLFVDRNSRSALTTGGISRRKASIDIRQVSAFSEGLERGLYNPRLFAGFQSVD